MDGSCTVEVYPELQLASWGVISATAGLVVSAAHLHGPTQTIDRAELSAVISAVMWGAHTELALCIWSDSLSTVQMAERIQTWGYVPDGVANFDLWSIFHQALQDRTGVSTDFRWIPSHLSKEQADDCFEEWVIHWNGLVDQLAVYQNSQRPASLWARLKGLRQLLDNTATRP